MQPTFTEIQRFNKWWHYVIICFPFVCIVVLFLLVHYDIIGTKDGTRDSYAFFTVPFPAILVMVWLLCLKLKTTINASGIFINFSGIPFCKKQFLWNEIRSIEVVTYSPLSDYGGWGVKYSITGNGWCYNVSGNKGIKMIDLNNKPFLLGTHKEEEATKIITHYFTA